MRALQTDAPTRAVEAFRYVFNQWPASHGDSALRARYMHALSLAGHDYSSTAYWCQTEPHCHCVELLPVEKPLPRLWGVLHVRACGKGDRIMPPTDPSEPERAEANADTAGSRWVMLRPAAFAPVCVVAFLSAIAATPVLISVCDVDPRWPNYGIASWGIGVLVKTIVTKRLPTGWSRRGEAAVEGLVSGLCELVPAALFLARMQYASPRLVDVLAFGVGIGSVEAMMLFPWPMLLRASSLPPRPLAWVLAGATERPVTLVGHTADRVLVFLAVSHAAPLPGLLALLSFTIVDGIAGYGQKAKWDWDDPRVLVPAEMFLAAVALAWAGLAWWFWRAMVR